MDILHDGRQLLTDEEPKCAMCGGRGEMTCLTCSGTGIKLGFGNAILDCPYCNGFGSMGCPDCNGTGYVQQENEEIPY